MDKTKTVNSSKVTMNQLIIVSNIVIEQAENERSSKENPYGLEELQ